MADTFLPTQDAQLVVWYNNFQLKFATYALTVGFVAADVTAVQHTQTHSATADAQPASQVLIKWVKGVFDGVSIESQRAGETTGTLIGMDTSSPYLDSRPPLVAGQPEVCRYRLRYFLNDVPTGDYSHIIVVTTTP